MKCWPQLAGGGVAEQFSRAMDLQFGGPEFKPPLPPPPPQLTSLRPLLENSQYRFASGQLPGVGIHNNAKFDLNCLFQSFAQPH